MGEEHRQIALADRERTAELLLGQRPQDQAALTEALTNLVDNAGRYAVRDRPVEIRVAKPKMPMTHRMIRSVTLLFSV